MKSVAWTFSLLLIVAALSGCKTKSHPVLEYMPDMYRQLSVRAQEADPHAPNGIGMRQPVAGTVPRGYVPYPYDLADTTQANLLANPLNPTMDVLAAGRKYFNSYCIVCHGARGDGRGFIVPKFTMPPSLLSDKIRAWPDGRIFHTITLGQGLMSSYATQLLPEQRWAVIHYVRALQRAARPTPEDLVAAKQSPFTLESDLPDTGKVERQPKK
jgi:mono/diheme cytochrome c family protein